MSLIKKLYYIVFSCVLLFGCQSDDNDHSKSADNADNENDISISHHEKELPNGDYLIHEAIRSGNFELVRQLSESGANLSVISSFSGYSPVYMAASNSPELLDYLIRNGASISFKTYLGFTPLHRAAAAGDAPSVHILLTHQAEVDAYNESGRTPLYSAVSSLNADTISLLLKHGANVDIMDNFEISIFEYLFQSHAVFSKDGLKKSFELFDLMVPYSRYGKSKIGEMLKNRNSKCDCIDARVFSNHDQKGKSH